MPLFHRTSLLQVPISKWPAGLPRGRVLKLLQSQSQPRTWIQEAHWETIERAQWHRVPFVIVSSIKRWVLVVGSIPYHVQVTFRRVRRHRSHVDYWKSRICMQEKRKRDSLRREGEWVHTLTIWFQRRKSFPVRMIPRIFHAPSHHVLGWCYSEILWIASTVACLFPKSGSARVGYMNSALSRI